MKRTGVFVPAEIWSLSDLSPNARVVLAEVFSFVKQGRLCFASNAHFAELLHLSPSGARKVVYELIKAGYLTRGVAETGQGAQIRTLCPKMDSPPPQIGHTPDPIRPHTKTPTKTTTKTRREKRPNLEEVVAAFTEIGASQHAAEFFDYYEANGWTQGKAGKPIKNWKAAARGWIRRAPQFKTNEKRKGFDAGNIDPESLRAWLDQ